MAATPRKSGLGRGLGALLPEAPDTGFAMVAIDAIDPNPHQPREHFDDEALDGLADSIREVGVLQPVVVRPPDEEGRHVLVAGERRWRASRMAGLERIPAILRDADDDPAGLTEALIENVQREDLSPLEEAAAYRQLMEDFGMTHEEIGERVGRSRSAISNTLRLLGLPAPIQALLEAGSLTAGAARALLPLEDAAYAEHVATRAASEGWSVRQVEEAVRDRLDGPDPAPTPRRRSERPTEVVELEQQLALHLESKVRIDYGAAGGGKVVGRFGSLDDLERIYRTLLGG
ncbi:MAG: ParB/RepB/Spo0J family partition protein [Acidimicrobiia bacterium]|nr:ParB/RepB/Spo0J family partition protein [Acidimicrobiia bacterium]